MQYIHIINDEKFVDGLISNYETVFPGKNRYVIISFSQKMEFHFVKNRDKTELVYYKSLIPYLDNLINKKSLLLIHGLDRIKLKVINKYKGTVKIGIHFWGADIYLLPKFIGTLFLRKTKILFIKRASIGSLFFNTFRGFYYHYMYKKTLKYVSVFSTVVETEKKFVNRYLMNAKYANFNYADIEGLGLYNTVINRSAKNILIGNSSSYTSNHIDVFEIINNIDVLKPLEKVIPLNYGDKIYAKDVMKYISNKKLKNFTTLVDFLPSDQYLKVLSNCSIAIMGHQRQQAVGNLLICLWLGMRVFLSKNNPVYHDYKNRGMVIFSIEDDLLFSQSTSLLKIENINNNRMIIEDLYSKTNTYNHIIHIIKLMNE